MNVGTDSVAGAGPRRRVSLRVSLVAFSLMTVALTAAAVHLPWRHVSADNVADVAGQLNAEIVAGVNREVGALFDSALAAQETLHAILRDGVVDVDDDDRRDALFLAALTAHPHFSWVSFGRPNGDFHGAQRRGEALYSLADSVWIPARNGAERVERHFAREGGELVQTRTRRLSNDYHAPARAWYRRAMERPGRHVWTDIYVFEMSRKPGLNAAVALTRRGEAEPVGVLSVAIELERVSRYMAGLTSLRSGAAFIVDAEGYLIAFPDLAEITYASLSEGGGHEAALKPLGASANPLLQAAAAGVAGIDLAALDSPTQTVALGADGRRLFLTLAPGAREGWIVGTVIPVDDFTARIERNRLILAGALLAAVLLVGLTAQAAARRLFIRPINALIENTGHIARFDLAAVRPAPSRLIEIDALSHAIERMSRGLGSFRRYLPAELVRGLVESGLEAELGGERRTVSIMFMDLEGFTGATERLGHRVVPLLGDYFTAMTAAVEATGGTVDKFMGDAVMAFWGAPRHDEEHPTAVCRAALACQAAMADLRARWADRNLPPLRLRIGVNTGRVVVGNIGAPERLSYTVVGEPVNLAAMLEAMCKDCGAGVLISQHTFEMAKFDVVARRIDAVKLKGAREPVAVYELLAMRDENGAAPGFEWVAAFEDARAHLVAGRRREAAEGFRAVLAERPGDGPAAAFLQRCEADEAAPPRPNVAALPLAVRRAEPAEGG